MKPLFYGFHWKVFFRKSVQRIDSSFIRQPSPPRTTVRVCLEMCVGVCERLCMRVRVRICVIMFEREREEEERNFA